MATWSHGNKLAAPWHGGVGMRQWLPSTTSSFQSSPVKRVAEPRMSVRHFYRHVLCRCVHKSMYMHVYRHMRMGMCINMRIDAHLIQEQLAAPSTKRMARSLMPSSRPNTRSVCAPSLTFLNKGEVRDQLQSALWPTCQTTFALASSCSCKESDLPSGATCSCV